MATRSVGTGIRGGLLVQDTETGEVTEEFVSRPDELPDPSRRKFISGGGGGARQPTQSQIDQAELKRLAEEEAERERIEELRQRQFEERQAEAEAKGQTLRRLTAKEKLERRERELSGTGAFEVDRETQVRRLSEEEQFERRQQVVQAGGGRLERTEGRIESLDRGVGSASDLLLGGGEQAVSGGVITTRQVDTINGTPVNEVIVINNDGTERLATPSEVRRFNASTLTALPVEKDTTTTGRIGSELQDLETQSFREDLNAVGGAKQFGLTITRDIIETGKSVGTILTTNPIDTLKGIKAGVSGITIAGIKQGGENLGRIIRQQPAQATGLATSFIATTIALPTLAVRSSVKLIQAVKPTKFSTKFITIQQGNLGRTLAVTTRKGIVGERTFISGTKSISRVVDGKSISQSVGAFTELRGVTLGTKQKFTDPKLFLGAELGTATQRTIPTTIAGGRSVKVSKLTEVTELRGAGATLNIDDFLRGKKPQPFLTGGVGVSRKESTIIFGRDVGLKRTKGLPTLARQERGGSVGAIIPERTPDVDFIGKSVGTIGKQKPFTLVDKSIEQAITQSIKPRTQFIPSVKAVTEAPLGTGISTAVGGRGLDLETTSFVGTGTFERTDVGGRLPSVEQPRITPIVSTIQPQAVTQGLKLNLATDQAQKQLQKNLLKESLTSRQSLISRSALKQAQVLRQKQILKLSLRTPFPVRPRPRGFRFPIRPRGFVFPKIKRGISGFKTGKVQLFVKQKGIFIPKGTFSNVAQAQARGVFLTGSTIDRSFKILGGKVGVPTGFRRSRAKGLENVFVELSKTALSQRGEQFAVQRARRRKRK